MDDREKNAPETGGEKPTEKKASLYPQLRCLVALYVGYLGISLTGDVFSGRVQGGTLWLCAVAAVVFLVGAVLVLMRDLPKILKKP